MSEFIANYRKRLIIAVSAVVALIILIVVLATTLGGQPTNGFYNTTTLESAVTNHANQLIQPYGDTVTADQCVRNSTSDFTCTVLTDNPNVSEIYSVHVGDNGTTWLVTPIGPAQ